MATVNRDGFLVTYRTSDKIRTYGCSDRAALDALILRLTGKHTEKLTTEDLNSLPHVSVASGFHIWSSEEKDLLADG